MIWSINYTYIYRGLRLPGEIWSGNTVKMSTISWVKMFNNNNKNKSKDTAAVTSITNTVSKDDSCGSNVTNDSVPQVMVADMRVFQNQLQVRIGESQVWALIDSGANTSVMSCQLANKVVRNQKILILVWLKA